MQAFSRAPLNATLDIVVVTYLLYTPIDTLADDAKTGGALCIKTGTVLAYVGFATEALAKEFCTRWAMEEAKIITASELGVDYPVLAQDIRTIVRFPDASTLATYMAAPGVFPCDQYFVST